MSLLEGVIPKVEAQEAHHDFVQAVEPDAVLTSIVEARKLVKRGETADSYFGRSTDVIVTTTVPDEQLRRILWRQERDIVTEFEPAYHIPTDYSIYGWHDQEERMENLSRLLDGTRWMHGELADTDTVIVPQVKGFTKPERKLTYSALNTVDHDCAIFYATQYFTPPYADGKTQLIEDLQTIRFERSIDVFLIGTLSPQVIEEIPPNVTAVSGETKWLSRVEPRQNTAEEMRDEYERLAGDVEEALQSD